jgi:hypothetical protein
MCKALQVFRLASMIKVIPPLSNRELRATCLSSDQFHHILFSTAPDSITSRAELSAHVLFSAAPESITFRAELSAPGSSKVPTAHTSTDTHPNLMTPHCRSTMLQIWGGGFVPTHPNLMTPCCRPTMLQIGGGVTNFFGGCAQCRFLLSAIS